MFLNHLVRAKGLKFSTINRNKFKVESIYYKKIYLENNPSLKSLINLLVNRMPHPQRKSLIPLNTIW